MIFQSILYQHQNSFNMKKQIKLPVDELITIGGELISDKPPTTFFGRVFRVLKKLIRVKDDLNIKVK